MSHQSYKTQLKSCEAKLTSKSLTENKTVDECDEDTQFTIFLAKLSKIGVDKVFGPNGYKQLNKICDTLQGGLYKAQQISNNQIVAIKKTDKSLFSQQIAIEDGMNFCVSENIIKEALILRYLSVDNNCIGDYIIKFIKFFESETDYFLVMEYIESGINLKEFVCRSHQEIKNGKLKFKEYQKLIKYICWQIAVTIYWLHHDMKSCHLDLCLENIMMENCKYIEGDDGYLAVNPKISIKLGDFGNSEVFKTNESFQCAKYCLSLENELFLAPNIRSNQVYDARLADMWSLGMILYECMSGEPLYKTSDIWQSSDFDEDSTTLYPKELDVNASMRKGLKYFSCISFDLLSNLLNVNEKERFNGIRVLKHKWFSSYYNKYCKQISTKSDIQKQRLYRQRTKMMQFPFYSVLH